MDKDRVVLLGRIELPTSPLPRVRSTTELQQRASGAPRGAGQARAIVAAGANVKHGLRRIAMTGMAAGMSHASDNRTREERLAAKLRENLHRRKAQARALGNGSKAGEAQPSENDSAALPNPLPES